MHPEEFKHLAKRILNKAGKIRNEKKEEYLATKDRLSNFRKAAELDSCSVPMAVKGMMAKHTVSIFDMVNNDFPRHPTMPEGLFSLEAYEKKICDHINYLLLLYAAVVEARRS